MVACTLSNQASGSRTLDHLRLRVMPGELAPVGRARPVHLRAVALEHRVPVHGLAAGRRLPGGELGGVVAHLEHVVAGAEAELLERQLQRVGPRAPEAGPDDLERHGVSSDAMMIRPAVKWPACRGRVGEGEVTMGGAVLQAVPGGGALGPMV